MPNRRRRRLSTATSAVAALAVVSPFAISAISEMTEPAPQPREFRSAAMVTDLPNELMSALSQGLSQFGINLPAMPTRADRRGHGYADDVDRPRQPRVAGPGVARSHAWPHRSGSYPRSGHAGPRHRSGGRYGADRFGAGQSGVDPRGSDTRGSGGPAGACGRRDGGGHPGPQPRADQPDRGTSRRSDDASGRRSRPGAGDDADQQRRGPARARRGADLAPSALIPLPVPTRSLAATPDSVWAPCLPRASTGSSGFLGEISTALQNLGAGQAIDLLKGTVMPMITSAMKPPVPAAPPVPAPPPPPVPAG